MRFWGVNTGVPAGNTSKEELDFAAARFAKLGINVVRIHGALFDRNGDNPTRIDPARLDNYLYLVTRSRNRASTSICRSTFPYGSP